MRCIYIGTFYIQPALRREEIPDSAEGTPRVAKVFDDVNQQDEVVRRNGQHVLPSEPLDLGMQRFSRELLKFDAGLNAGCLESG